MTRLVRVFLFLSVLSTAGFSQQKFKKNDSQLWLQYFLNLRIHEHYSIHFDGGFRRRDDLIHKPLNWLARTAFIYHINKEVNIAGGFAFFNANTESYSNTFYRPEYRPYIRLFINQNVSILQIQHRYRVELRNTQKTNQEGTINDYTSIFRFGYQTNFQLPLKGKNFGKGIPYLAAYNELFINFGKQALNNFDQDRIFLGVGYGISSTISLTMGYQYIFAQRGRENFENLNTIRFNILQNFDFRKPEVDHK